jgi:tripartite-type tricarboxylate transporter receptor subunit TctC
MNTLRYLLALLLLSSSSVAFAQNLTLTVNVSAAAGGPVDTVARSLGKGLRTILGKRDQYNYLLGEAGAVAAREFRNAPADGSQILVLHATVGQPAPEVSGLVPIATIAGQSSRYQWVGVFAPPGTPASTARELERAVLSVLRSPNFGESRPSGNLVPLSTTPGDGAQLARLIAQSAGAGGTSASTSTASAGSNAQADDPKVLGGTGRP